MLNATTRELTLVKNALDVAAIVAITDHQGNITHVNDKFCEISKYSRAELLGKNHRIIKSRVHPPEFFQKLWKTISSGHVWTGEICNRRKDNELYWVNTTIVPFLDESGKPYQYVSIRFDITAKKLAEAQLVSYSKRLEQSNEELEHFASIAAHDLQEPLRKIRAFSDRVNVKMTNNLSNEAIDYLGRISAAAGRMQNLIDDLLTYSRVRTRQSEFTYVDLNKVVADVTADLEIQIDKESAKIVKEHLPVIEADETQMHQLFLNLISNAIKFHKPGTPNEIFISSSVENNMCEIQVRDNGIGFDEKYLDRIFQIFQRLHGKSEFRGTGVGLAVCRRIVLRHGGDITARSEPDKGSVFIVRLPAHHRKEESYGG